MPVGKTSGKRWGGGGGGVRVTVALSAKMVNSRQAEVRWVTWVRLEQRDIDRLGGLTDLHQSGRD